MRRKKTIKISIPEPCQENWDLMTPKDKGRHCQKCDREIIDYSSYSDYALHQYFIKEGSFCGRFKTDQIGRAIEISEEGIKISPSLKRIAAAVAITSASIIGNDHLQAQTNSPLPQIENRTITKITYGVKSKGKKEIQPKTTKEKSTNIVVQGAVTEEETGEPLIGVSILIKGTNNGTVTDLDGNYQIEVDKVSTLIFSYIGYETVEQPINIRNGLNNVNLSQLRKVYFGADSNLNVQLTEGGFLMGEFVVCRVLVINRKKKTSLNDFKPKMNRDYKGNKINFSE